MVAPMKRTFRLCAAASTAWLFLSGLAPTPADDPSEHTRWSRTPTGDEMTRCQPAVTDIPDGSVVIRCQVGAAGWLEGCSALNGADRLKEWGLCLSGHFRADPTEAGLWVEIPLQWRSTAERQ